MTNNSTTDLSKLPPPPKGQVGLSAADLAKLPPPPKGQVGMTADQLKSKNLSPGSNLPIPEPIKNFVPNLKSDFKNLATDNHNLNQSNLSLPVKILGNVGNIFNGVSDIIGEGAKAAGLDKIISMIPTLSSEGKPSTLGVELPKSVATLKQVAAQIDKHHQVAKAIEDFHTQFPGSTEALKSVLQITGGLLSATGVSDAIEGGIGAFGEKTAAEDTPTLTTTIDNHINSAAENFKDAGEMGENGVTDLFKGNQTDLVRQLQSQGFNDIAKKVEGLDLSGAKTVEDYSSAIRNGLKDSTNSGIAETTAGQAEKTIAEDGNVSKMPTPEPTKPVQTSTMNPFKKVQQIVTSVPSTVRGSIRTLGRTLNSITDPTLREEAATELKDKFTNIMQSAKDSLADPDALKPHDVVGEEAIKPAIEDFNTQKDAIGKKIGEYKEAIGNKAVPGIKDVYEKFKTDVESTLRKRFDSAGGVPFEDGKVSLEDQAAFKAKGGDFNNLGDGKPRLVDTGKISVKLGSAEKQIVQTFQDFERAMKDGTVNDLDTIKTNMRNIIAKVGEESPSLSKQVGRIFTTAYKGMNKAISSVAEENGIKDWNEVNEEYGKFNDVSRDLNGVKDSQGNIDYSKLSKSSLTPSMRKTFDFLQSKTGVPVRAYSEFANWAEKAYSDSKINDLVKTIGVKAVGLPMMGFGRQVGNLVGDIPGKTFSLIDKELGGGASQLEKAINASTDLKNTLKSMGMTAKQGATMLISGLQNGGAEGAAKIGAGSVVNDKTK